ncbi:MAG TPA: hypothetical protein VMS78_04845 [Rhizomicrobium sp.]|nr:hypothetical protein [Rhizomicrobium sp.]
MTIEEYKGDSARFSGCNPAMPNSMLVLAEVERRTADEFSSAASYIERMAPYCNEGAIDALSRAVCRLRNYANAHRALLPPLSVDTLDLSLHIRRVCSALMGSSLADHGITLSLYETPVTIEAGRAWRIGLILSELISHAVVHDALPVAGGVIRVETTSDKFDIYVRVAGNGQGVKAFCGDTGTQIIDPPVEEMSGHIYRETHGDRATVLLTLPRTQA